jgi:hypothetical protein
VRRKRERGKKEERKTASFSECDGSTICFVRQNNNNNIILLYYNNDNNKTIKFVHLSRPTQRKPLIAADGWAFMNVTRARITYIYIYTRFLSVHIMMGLLRV